MTYDQLENCYKTVLKQRDDAEIQVQLKDDCIDDLLVMLQRILDEQHKYTPSRKAKGIEHYYVSRFTFEDVSKLIQAINNRN